MGKRMTVVLLLVALTLAGCAGRNEEAITVDVDVIYSDAGEMVTEPYTQVLEEQKQWKAQNPDVAIIERKRLRNGDISSLAVLGRDYLPDVFITDCLTGGLLARAGLVLDVSAYTDGEPTLTYDGVPYAFPILREKAAIVISDGAYTTIGYTDALDVLSYILADASGREWFAHIVEKDKQAAFTDRFFTQKLTELLECKSRMQKATIDDFVNGEISAILVSGDDVYRLLEKVKEADAQRYEKLSFETLSERAIPCGYNYGIFLNANLSKMPEKLEKCVELTTALLDRTEPDPDETLLRLHHRIEESPHSVYPSLLLTGVFWSTARSQCRSLLEDGDQTPAEYAAVMQNSYERYYLNVEDYSIKLDQYLKLAGG